MPLTTPISFSNFFQSNVRVIWEYTNPVDFRDLPVVYYLSGAVSLKNFHIFFINSFTIFIVLALALIYLLFKNNFFTKSLSICEEEVNSSDDFLLILSLFIFFFFFNFYGFFCLSHFTAPNVLFHLFSCLTVSLILVPFVALYNFGFYLIINIKGASASLSYFYELVQDNINLLSFFLRVCIQLVRVITITVTYFGYNHLVMSYNFRVTSVNLSFSALSLSLVRLLFELLHTIIIFIAQMLSLFMMVLWLFQFLFTVFVSKIPEVTYKKA